MTRDRANEIIQQSQDANTGCGYDWVEHLHDFLTPAEEAEIKDRWQGMPGWSCWWDAFNSFRFAQ